VTERAGGGGEKERGRKREEWCMCVCVCETERERREGGRKREEWGVCVCETPRSVEIRRAVVWSYKALSDRIILISQQTFGAGQCWLSRERGSVLEEVDGEGGWMSPIIQ
jgi:hypothetical protein